MLHVHLHFAHYQRQNIFIDWINVNVRNMFLINTNNILVIFITKTDT